MNERLLFSKTRKEEFKEKIEEELLKHRHEIERQLENKEQIQTDLLIKISEKILTDEIH